MSALGQAQPPTWREGHLAGYGQELADFLAYQARACDVSPWTVWLPLFSRRLASLMRADARHYGRLVAPATAFVGA